MLDKCITTIIIIISELGIKEIKPSVRRGLQLPTQAVLPSLYPPSGMHKLPTFPLFFNRDSRTFRTDIPIKRFSLSMLFI